MYIVLTIGKSTQQYHAGVLHAAVLYQFTRKNNFNSAVIILLPPPLDASKTIATRGQSNLTKSASRGAHSSVRGHTRGSKVVPLNSWGRVSY